MEVCGGRKKLDASGAACVGGSAGRLIAAKVFLFSVSWFLFGEGNIEES